MHPERGEGGPQLPRPTLWPIGLGVGVVCVLVGLVVSWPAVAVGGAITLVFGFLWLRDVTAGIRVQPPPEPVARARQVAPEPPPLGAHARFPRSKFLEGSTLGLGAVIGGIVTVPSVLLAAVPPFLKQGGHGIDIGPLSDYPESEWRIATFFLNPEEGEVTRRTAYIRNNGPLDGQPSFTIISNRCAHLGCPVQPLGLYPDSPTKREKTAGGEVVELFPVTGLSGFGCPCHGGAYDPEGNRTAGPPVRGLDRYSFSIRKGRLYLETTYSVSTVDGSGADAKIHKYRLASPGNHVDGWEQVLYPWQPPH